jgi:hypothetical protein
LEKEWLGGATHSDKPPVARVKQLRIAILPDMVDGDLSEQERVRRWDQLADMYLVQQLGHYPPDYVRSHPTKDRLLETVERFEEDLTDACRIYRPMSVTVDVGASIPVGAKRQRGAAEDPVMVQINAQLHELLGLPTTTDGPADNVPVSDGVTRLDRLGDAVISE